MKYNYQISLLKGNHGVWFFVKKDDKTIFEQSGLKDLEEVLSFTRSIIEGAESEKL